MGMSDGSPHESDHCGHYQGEVSGDHFYDTRCGWCHVSTAPEGLICHSDESNRAAGVADLAAFPVLPMARPALVDVPPVAAPPPWTTPRPLMTPVPSGPSLLGDQTSERRRIRRSLIVFGTLGVLAAAALLAILW